MGSITGGSKDTGYNRSIKSRDTSYLSKFFVGLSDQGTNEEARRRAAILSEITRAESSASHKRPRPRAEKFGALMGSKNFPAWNPF